MPQRGLAGYTQCAVVEYSVTRGSPFDQPNQPKSTCEQLTIAMHKWW